MRKLLPLFIVAIAFAANTTTAVADEVTFTGTARGCYGVCAIVAPNTSFQDLVFNGSTFSGTTNGGLLALGAAANQSGNVNNLGSFKLNPFSIGYNNIVFTLVITLTAPVGINSGIHPIRIGSTIQGSVNQGAGGIHIDFDNTPQLFTYSGANGTGAFLFSVNDLSVGVNGLVPITGNFRTITVPETTPTPEPATLLLLGTGISGIVAGLRRRFRQ